MTNHEQQVFAHTEACLFLDFYGQLLTGRCRTVLEMHFGEDMSLGEIAENLGISRQAVHDRIRQGLLQLHEYEKVLGLAARFNACQADLEGALQALEQGQDELVRAKLLQLKADL